MEEKRIIKLGHIEKGTGCHQSNAVYCIGGGGTHDDGRVCNLSTADHDSRYVSCNKTSYCIDANYWKGGTIKSFFEKRRRQLIFERWEKR